MIHYDKCWLSWLQRKVFLYAAVGGPDARLLKESSIFHKISKGDVLPDRVISQEILDMCH